MIHTIILQIILAFVCASTGLAIANETALSIAMPPPLHEQFRSPSINVVDLDNQDGQTVLIDGKAIPAKFEISLRWTVGQVPIEPLEFVLFVPNSDAVEVDGLLLKSEGPFYICTRQISQEQYAALYTDGGGGFRDYVSAEAYWTQTAEADAKLQLADMEFVSQYVANPNLPALLMDVSKASRICAAVEARSGLDVRMPTLAEWFFAMRGGEVGSEFWSGADLPWESILWPSDGGRGDKSMLLRAQFVAQSLHPLGLIDIIGAAADIVLPSDDERRLLERYYGVGAIDAIDISDGLPAFEPASHAAFRLGAGIDSISDFAYDQVEDAPDMETFNKSLYRLSLTRWKSLLGDQQVFVNHGWCYQKHWATALRCVIDVPIGDMSVIGSTESTDR